MQRDFRSKGVLATEFTEVVLKRSCGADSDFRIAKTISQISVAYVANSCFANFAALRETIFMEIKHIEKGGRGAFLIRGEDGKRLAEMTYVTAGETGFIIDHTEVDESLRGQKVGDKLLAEAVKYAREKGLKIFATCPFAIRKLQEDPEYSDVYSG